MTLDGRSDGRNTQLERIERPYSAQKKGTTMDTSSMFLVKSDKIGLRARRIADRIAVPAKLQTRITSFLDDLHRSGCPISIDFDARKEISLLT